MQTPPPLPPAQAHALLHLTVFVWGFTAILGRLISLQAVALVWYRLLLVVLVMGGVIVARRFSFRIPAGMVGRYALAGLFVALHWLLFYGCIKYAGVAVAVLCLSAISFFTSMIEPLLFRRRVLLWEVLLGLLVTLGVGVLVKVETQTDGLGLALGLGAALFSALFGVLNGQLALASRAEVMAFYELASAAAVTSCFFLLWPNDFVAPAALSGRDIVWLVVLAVVCTVLPWLWTLRVLKTLSPYTVALAVSLEPVYAMALAYVIFPGSEQLTWRFYGGACILVGLVAANAGLRRRR